MADDDLAQGTHYEYHDNGNASFAIEYERGKLHGAIRRWDADGNLLYEAKLVDDVLQGPYRRWHPNGEVSEEGTYVDGQRHGPLIMYAPDGSVLVELEMDNGVPVEDEDATA